MTYYYDGNKLKGVDDASTTDHGYDFNDHGSSSNNRQSFECQYDNNGNMNVDAHKSIAEINYNHLNLPTKLSFVTNKRIEWLYSAAGGKLHKTVYYYGA
jgi:hypothetical protein